jgi:hypothetical protein
VWLRYPSYVLYIEHVLFHSSLGLTRTPGCEWGTLVMRDVSPLYIRVGSSLAPLGVGEVPSSGGWRVDEHDPSLSWHVAWDKLDHGGGVDLL